MKKECGVCKKEFIGRSDKKYCSLDCKNKFNNQLRSTQSNIIAQIDIILHRNHHILTVLFGGGKTKKIKIQKLVLLRAGFDFTHYTGTYTNNKNKRYNYVYDFAWMEFSTQEVLIVKK
jgi:hypothetical protein